MSKGGGETVTPTSNKEEKHGPKGLIEAISEIEYYYAQERRGSILTEGFFTTNQKIDYFAIGLRTSFISGLVTALFTPFAIGVLEKLIPVFGSAEPTSWDKFFVFLMALGYSIGYASFITPTAYCYIGAYTKAMIRSLIGGVITGAFAKMVIAFLLFHFIYMILLSDDNLNWVAINLYKAGLSRDYTLLAYNWVQGFKPVFLTSAWFVVVTTIIFISVPLLSIGAAMIRNRKLREAGLLDNDN